MIILYIAVFVVACGFVGKLVARSSDRNAQRFRDQMPRGQRSWTNSLADLDPVENPRSVDDGTEFGYKEFD
jgi:hypothetical protein